MLKYNFLKSVRPEQIAKKNGIDILIESSPWRMDTDERTKMTVACRDTDYIPKVPKAGRIIDHKAEKVQLMHNGLKVTLGGYHGEWMSNIITKLKGHHEPQEEKAFYEVIKRLKEGNIKPKCMIELGAFWAYYSLWFKQAFPGAAAYCLEPDPANMAVGKKNAAINSLDLNFIEGAAGNQDGRIITFQLDSDPAKEIKVSIQSVDKLVERQKLTRVDILHMDVQGVELDALRGAEKLIDSGNLRFLFVSTHHYFFSRDVLTHQKCLEFITAHGGHVVTSHNVLESYSGDGLIVASFDKSDSDFTIETSVNISQHSLFRPYEEDLAILLQTLDLP